MIRTFCKGLWTRLAEDNIFWGVWFGLPPPNQPLNWAIAGTLNWEWSHWRIQWTLNCGVGLEINHAPYDCHLNTLLSAYHQIRHIGFSTVLRPANLEKIAFLWSVVLHNVASSPWLVRQSTEQAGTQQLPASLRSARQDGLAGQYGDFSLVVHPSQAHSWHVN